MRILKILIAVIALMVAAGLGYFYYIGAWHILFPSSSHDRVFAGLPDGLQRPAVLVFSKTNRFRHRDGIEGGRKALAEIAESNSWGVYATENGAVFNSADLEKVDAVVFLNATGDMLSRKQELVFQEWLEGGGGWLGIHAAGDGSHAEWDWYMDNLIGVEFKAHILGPQFQEASVVTQSAAHPVNTGMPQRWQHSEEWYSWKSSPRGKGFSILATVDEKTYSPVQKLLYREVDLRMGNHPVVWSNCVGRGRAVYSAMGHGAAAFESPEYRVLLQNAMGWIMNFSVRSLTQSSSLKYGC